MNLGCRRLTYESCILASASAYYQCSTGSGSVYDFGICQTANDAADQACRNQFPGHTTRSTSQQLDARCDGNNTTRMSNTIFDFADSDGTGNLTLLEYFMIMGLSMGDYGPEIAQRSMRHNLLPHDPKISPNRPLPHPTHPRFHPSPFHPPLLHINHHAPYKRNRSR